MALILPSTVYGGEVNVEGAGQETWALLTLTGEENWEYRYIYIPTDTSTFWAKMSSWQMIWKTKNHRTWWRARLFSEEVQGDLWCIRVYPEFCVNVLRECKQQKLV